MQDFNRLETVNTLLEKEIQRLTVQTETLHFCLDQARIVLEHFRTELPDPEHRRIAEGAMIASAPPGTLPGENRQKDGGFTGYDEGCCWTDPNDHQHCPMKIGRPCSCRCHQED